MLNNTSPTASAWRRTGGRLLQLYTHKISALYAFPSFSYNHYENFIFSPVLVAYLVVIDHLILLSTFTGGSLCSPLYVFLGGDELFGRQTMERPEGLQRHRFEHLSLSVCNRTETFFFQSLLWRCNQRKRGRQGAPARSPISWCRALLCRSCFSLAL